MRFTYQVPDRSAVAEIQRDVTKRGQRSGVSRVFHAKNDKETIATWRLDLNRILHVFNVRLVTLARTTLKLTVCFQTELAISTSMAMSELQRNVSDIHRTMVGGQEGTDGKHQSVSARLYSILRRISTYRCPDSSQVGDPNYRWIQRLMFTSSVLGESPPPPGACLGREDLIEKIVGVADHLTPIALIGAGGIGKTSIALTVLHHDRIKERFGANRRFIRCDQFPASRAHFLSRLSKVIGAGIENPEDLTPLRPFLSSREMILVLDNAESLLDPQETGAREIYTMVEELSRFDTVCLIVTSRISTVPRRCKRPTIPTLSMESACDIFYGIHDSGGRSDIISSLLRRLDFHALSITLLATTASHNVWDYDRLAEEWDAHRTQVLRTDYDESLATTIDLSLASPTFRGLGPDARDLLGVVAFFPQGIDENNLGWLFPTISGGKNMFDKFCALSLTYRGNGFVSMLAPLRDHLRPKDPTASPLLHTIKERYFTRLSVHVEPGSPCFEKAQWIISEDTNVEHLLDVFTLIDANSIGVWDACGHFIRHICWYKPRLVVLGPKIERLSDDHPSKAWCLFQLSSLFNRIGNHTERKRLLIHSLKLDREKGDDSQAAQTLQNLSDANRMLGLYGEGIQQAMEALEIREQLNDRLGQAHTLDSLARLLRADRQLDGAESAAIRAIGLLPEKGGEFRVAQCYRLLGNIYHSKGEAGMAIKHLKAALGVASPFNWQDELFWIHYSLAESFFGENRTDDAHAHIERAKLHATDEAYKLGRAMELQAGFWYEEGRFEEAKFAASCAANTYEKVGATKNVENCRKLLLDIEKEIKESVISGG